MRYNEFDMDDAKVAANFVMMLLLNSVLGGLILFIAFNALHTASPASWPLYASALYTISFNLNSTDITEMSVERTVKNTLGLIMTGFWWLLS